MTKPHPNQATKVGTAIGAESNYWHPLATKSRKDIELQVGEQDKPKDTLSLWQKIRSVPPIWVLITVLLLHTLFTLILYWRGIELVSLVALGALGSVASLLACFLTIAIYNRQSEESRAGLKETIRNLEIGLNRTVERLERLTRETIDELEKLEPPEAIELVKGWFDRGDLLKFEFFSPFSEVPLFWHNERKAMEIVGLFTVPEYIEYITLIGPSKEEFVNLCKALNSYIHDNDLENLPPRINNWLRVVNYSTGSEKNTALQATDANQEDDKAILSLDESTQVSKDLPEVIQEEYQTLARLLSKINIKRSSAAAKLITGFAFAQFSSSHSRRPGEVYEMLIFSDKSLEEQTKLRTATSDEERVQRVLTGPIIYRTKNRLIINGLRDAVWAILKQENPGNSIAIKGELKE